MTKRLVIILCVASAALLGVGVAAAIGLAQPSAADQERERTMIRLCEESTADWTFDECMENLRSRP